MSDQTPQSEHPASGVSEIARLNDWLRENITSPAATASS